MTLLELHRALLEGQRLDVERLNGRLSAGQLLQAAADDLRFAWLRPLTQLIAALDAGKATSDDVRALLAAPDAGTAFGGRYLRALQEDPSVVFAHRDVMIATTTTSETTPA